QISEKQRILVELPDIFQKSSRQAQTLLECLVKKRKVSQRHHACDCSRDHPDHRAAGHRQRRNAGEKLRGVFTSDQMEPLSPELFPKVLITGLQVIAEREEPDFARRLPCGHQPVVVPGAPLERSRATTEFMLA